MNWPFILLIFVIPFAVWVLSSLFRNQDQRPGQQRNAEGRQRPRLQSSDIDRFLEEINRRRRSAGERAGVPVEEIQPVPPPEPPRVSRTDVPPRRQPAPQSEPPRVSRTDVPPRRRPPSSTPRPPRPKPARRIAEVVQIVAAAPPPVLTVAPAPLPSTPVEVHVPPTVARRPDSPVLAPLVSMLRSPPNLMAGLVLQEILGPPLCKRPRRLP